MACIQAGVKHSRDRLARPFLSPPTPSHPLYHSEMPDLPSKDRSRGTGWFTLQSLPEQELFPTKEQSSKAMRRACWKMVGRWPWILAVLVAIGVSLFATLVLRKAAYGLGLPIAEIVINLILMFPVMIGASLVSLWMLNKHLAKHLRLELLECGVPVCQNCGYHLIGVRIPECPECPECGGLINEAVREVIDRAASTTATDPSS